MDILLIGFPCIIWETELVQVTHQHGDDDTDLFQNVTWNTATNQNEDIFIRYSLTVANSTGLLQD